MEDSNTITLILSKPPNLELSVSQEEDKIVVYVDSNLHSSKQGIAIDFNRAALEDMEKVETIKNILDIISRSFSLLVENIPEVKKWKEKEFEKIKKQTK